MKILIYFSFCWAKLETQIEANFWLPQILPGWYCSSPQWDPHERTELVVWWTSPAGQACQRWACCSTAPPGLPDSGPQCSSENISTLYLAGWEREKSHIIVSERESGWTIGIIRYNFWNLNYFVGDIIKNKTTEIPRFIDAAVR